MLKRHLIILPVLLAGLAMPVLAGEAPVGKEIVGIVVTGRRPAELRRFMSDFIVEIGVPASRGRGYARWRDPLCVAIYNLPNQPVAQYIVDRISHVALEAGLKNGRAGCDPNQKIIFSPDAKELASSMVESNPLMFLPWGKTEGTTRGPAALEQFKTSDAPVRWWQITMPVDEIGYPAIYLPDFGTPLVRATASRIKSTVSDAIWGSLIIVDAGKLEGVEWSQLADYLAMVTLAQINPNGRPAETNSILSLFSATKAPGGLTDLDMIYLRSLYEMDTMMQPYTQRGVFSHMMVRIHNRTEE